MISLCNIDSIVSKYFPLTSEERVDYGRRIRDPPELSIPYEPINTPLPPVIKNTEAASKERRTVQSELQKNNVQPSKKWEGDPVPSYNLYLTNSDPEGRERFPGEEEGWKVVEGRKREKGKGRDQLRPREREEPATPETFITPEITKSVAEALTITEGVDIGDLNKVKEAIQKQ